MKAGIIQVDPSANTGLTEKSGYLAKRPENVLRIPRRQWPKRYCTVSGNGFTMAHSHVSLICPFIKLYVHLFTNNFIYYLIRCHFCPLFTNVSIDVFYVHSSDSCTSCSDTSHVISV